MKQTKQKNELTTKHKILILFLTLTVFFVVFGTAVWAQSRAQPAENIPSGQIQALPVASIERYETIQKEQMDIYRGDLLLVNSEYPYRFTDKEQSLVSVYDYKNSSYKVKDRNVLLDKSVLEPLNNMLSAFKKETGSGNVNIISGHRTYSYQENLLRERTEEEGETAKNWVASPGASEHHTGQAMDFGIYDEKGRSFTFKGTGVYEWIREHAWEYGFIVRYQEEKSGLTGIFYEPWHYRYVGLPHAAIITQKGFCYEEYIDYLRTFPFEGNHLFYTDQTGSYEIYFTAKLLVPVPIEGAYSVSGNNADGFIITVRLS